MTDISSGFIDPGDNRDADRMDLPVTQVDEEEVEAHRSGEVEEPEGQGAGIGGEPSRLPADGSGGDDSDGATE
ncbi:hypothetical protein [Agromyces sp. NPDC060279]|uniref:hypothetical protein n=1 Tax=Agromyces sp. NPDC060279 TaxID=3347092 RepID=UPI0036694099